MSIILPILFVTFIIYLFYLGFIAVSYYAPLNNAKNYRIIEHTTLANEKYYVIQQRLPFMFYWINCYKSVGYDTYEIMSYHNKSKAENDLQHYLHQFTSHKNSKIISSTVVSTTMKIYEKN